MHEKHNSMYGLYSTVPVRKRCGAQGNTGTTGWKGLRTTGWSWLAQHEDSHKRQACIHMYTPVGVVTALVCCILPLRVMKRKTPGHKHRKNRSVLGKVLGAQKSAKLLSALLHDRR